MLKVSIIVPSKTVPSPSFTVIDLIRAKRDKEALTAEQIQYFVDQLTSVDKEQRAHESQIGAFLMASFLNGLNTSETSALTKSMAFSGFMFEWPLAWKGCIVDKHSTGGVGDKVSLILAPALAACGLKVPMISGRGLDFTGGTLDKLESIPGFSVSLSKAEMYSILDSVGCCIVGQTDGIVPADKILYAVRDTTATVENEDLIVASIISKKAAEGLDALVLDVKTGKGALMKDLQKAKSLASKLVTVGNSFGIKVTALITNMDAPLGNAVGNALEVAEAIDSLRNEGPDDLHQLVLALGGQLLASTGHSQNSKDGEDRIEETLKTGSALTKFQEMLVGQGTIPSVAEEICRGNKWAHLPKAFAVTPVKASKSGFVNNIDALLIAKVCHALGCGRSSPGQPIKYEPGVVLCAKLGQYVHEGEIVLEVHHGSSSAKEEQLLISQLGSSYEISNTQLSAKSLVLDIIT